MQFGGESRNFARRSCLAGTWFFVSDELLEDFRLVTKFEWLEWLSARSCLIPVAVVWPVGRIVSRLGMRSTR